MKTLLLVSNTIIVSLFLVGCVSSVRYTQSIRLLSPIQQRLLDAAAALVGTPYCIGKKRQDCLDCSGFVQKVFHSVGQYLPRTVLQQLHAGEPIEIEELQGGDLVFFRFDNNMHVSHVGIYCGDGTIYHASQSRGVVREQLWGGYLQRALVQCRRVLAQSD